MPINNVNELLNVVEVTQQYLNSSSFPESALMSSLKQPYKSNIESTACRNIGNDEYKRGDSHYEALEWYTKSVAWATKGSRELALAYGNRSSVLLRLRMYEACLLDVNRALKCDCPDKTKEIIVARREQCLAALRSKGSLISEDQTDPVVESTTTSNDNRLPKLNQNSLLPTTSSKIKLAYNKKWGTHMVAAKDIEPGEILSVEEFIGASLSNRQSYTHCSYCFVKCEALIGCLTCSKMMYCSSQCRTRAHNAYHRVECAMWPFYEDERLDFFDIAAVRTFLAGTEQGAKLSSLANKIGSVCGNSKIDFVNRRFKKDYLSVLKLHWTSLEPPKMYVLLAVKVIMVLQHLSFFENSVNDDSELDRAKKFATIALIAHLTSINNFSFPMWDISPNETNESFDNEYPIGLGACALHNLVNHSCDPNVANVMKKRKHYYFSVRPISQGQQIFFSYGVTFSKNSLKERKVKLRSYGFVCHCKACIDEWPLYSSLKKKNPEFTNKNRKATESLLSIRRMLTMADNYRESTAETFENAVRCSKTIRQIMNAPSALIITCERLITRCIRKSFGNFYYEYGVTGENDEHDEALDEDTDTDEGCVGPGTFFNYLFHRGENIFMSRR